MRFSLGCELRYLVTSPTTLLLNIEALNAGQQQVMTESLMISPEIVTESYIAPETQNLYRRLLLAPGNYNIRYEAEVLITPQIDSPGGVQEVPVSELPLEVLAYLYPSRYCQSDRLGRFVRREFGNMAGGHERVTAICNWIYGHVDYLAGASDGMTSAYDTLTLRAGVCRDFAHLGITFCRALGIPARFVSAYGWQLTPQDFHAVFEAYLGGRWYTFDATRLCPLDGIVRIGVGRDAADTAFATYYGQLQDAPKSVWIAPIDGPSPQQQWTTDAVSVTTG